ncbi:DUF2911 domain-containing protein [uncultured Microscilla sp.]|uniref:DUF2911 domain-containing protein n=1 Tax=uncultured Microscilla sp. TaxID=432653 RepID=UPI0026380F39|nr:DUF2911 domain-containing protein [uncultured Microscilla sp.]
MKLKYILSMLTLVAVVFAADIASAQKKMRGLDKSPLDMAYPRRGAKKVKVIYSRPYKKGRDIFGGIVKYDKLWRTGANEATEIRFAQDVKFGGKAIKAGTYALFTVPGKDKWTIILNKDYDQWGTSGYKEANDVARIEVPAKNDAKKSLENFSIRFGGNDKDLTMVLGWDKTRVRVPMSF